jgi:hypothetical protein
MAEYVSRLQLSTIYLEGFEQSKYNQLYVQVLLHIFQMLPLLRHLVVKLAH